MSALELFHCLPLLFLLSTPVDNSEATWKKATKCNKSITWPYWNAGFHLNNSAQKKHRKRILIGKLQDVERGMGMGRFGHHLMAAKRACRSFYKGCRSFYKGTTSKTAPWVTVQAYLLYPFTLCQMFIYSLCFYNCKSFT